MLRKIILVALAAVVTHSFGAAQAPQAPAKTVVAAVKTDGKPLYVAGPVSDELKQKCAQTVTWNADDAAWLRTDFMVSPSFALVEESTRPAVKQIKGFLDAAAVMHFACVFLDTKEHFYVSVTPQKTVDGQKALPAVVVHGASKTEPAEFLVFLETVATKQAGGSWLSSILKGIGAVGTVLAGKVFVLDPFLNKRRADADASAAAKAAAEKARLAQEKLKADVCAEIKALETELHVGPFNTKDKDVKTLEAERDRLKLLKEVRDAEKARQAKEEEQKEMLKTEIQALEADLAHDPFDTKDKDVKALETERDRLKVLKEAKDAEKARLAEEARLAAEREAQRVAALLEQIRALEAELGGSAFDETGKTAAQCEVELARLMQAKARPAPRVDASGSTGSVTGDVDSGRGATGSGRGDRGLRNAALLASLRGMATEGAAHLEGFYNSDGTINFQHVAFDEIRQQILDEIERDMHDVKTVPLYKMKCSVCHKKGKVELAAETWCADCKEKTRVICEEIAPSAWQDISDAQIITLIKHPRNVSVETVPQVQSKFNSTADVINAIGSKFAVANAEFTKMVALADKAQEAEKIHSLLSVRQGVEGGVLKTGYLSDSVVEFNLRYAPVCGIAPCPEDQRARFGLLDSTPQENLPGLLVCCAHRSLMAGSKFNGNKDLYAVHDSFGINIFPLPMVEAEDIDGLQEDFLNKPGVMQALDTAVAQTLLAGKRVVFACNNGQNRSTGMMYFYLKRLLANAVSWYELTSWVHFNRNDCFDLLGAFSPALPNYCPKTKLIQQGLLRYVMADDFKKRGLLPADFTYEIDYQWPLGFGGASIDAAGSFLDDAGDEDVLGETPLVGSRRGGVVSSYTPPQAVVVGLKQQVAAFKFPATLTNYSDADLARMIYEGKMGELPNNDLSLSPADAAAVASGDLGKVKNKKAAVSVVLNKSLPFHKIVEGLYLGGNEVTLNLVKGRVSSLDDINNLNKDAWGPGSWLLEGSGLDSRWNVNPEAMPKKPGLIVVVAEERQYADKLIKADELEINLAHPLLPQLKNLGESKYLYCPCLEDGSDTFAIDFEGKYQHLIFRAIDEARANDEVVLVHCSNGAHRSATIMLWYLKARTQASFWWLNTLLRARRPQVLDVRDLFIADAARKGNMMKAALYRSCGIDQVA